MQAHGYSMPDRSIYDVGVPPHGRKSPVHIFVALFTTPHSTIMRRSAKSEKSRPSTSSGDDILEREMIAYQRLKAHLQKPEKEGDTSESLRCHDEGSPFKYTRFIAILQPWTRYPFNASLWLLFSRQKVLYLGVYVLKEASSKKLLDLRDQLGSCNLLRSLDQCLKTGFCPKIWKYRISGCWGISEAKTKHWGKQEAETRGSAHDLRFEVVFWIIGYKQVSCHVNAG